MYGVLLPLPSQGGGLLPPQISVIPAFSIMMKTIWSKYVPVGGACGTTMGVVVLGERRFAWAMGRITATSPRIIAVVSSTVARLRCRFGALIKKSHRSLVKTYPNIFDWKYLLSESQDAAGSIMES